ncbi:MAG: uracil phosphoribosyltransferase [Candidatus Korarchaeota archaeon]
MPVYILENSVIQSLFTKLRDKRTPTNMFWQLLKKLGYLMSFEVFHRENLSEKVEVETVFKRTSGIAFNKKILIVEILRAAVPFASGAIDLADDLGMPRVVGVVDAKRIENSSTDGKKFDIEMRTFKVPHTTPDVPVIIYDPMLATASTMIETVRRIKSQNGSNRIIAVSVVAAEYGVEKLLSEFPDINLYVLAVDREEDRGLNKIGYIVPGLGDCGDRAFGT